LIYIFSVTMLLSLAPRLTPIALLPYPFLLLVVRRLSRSLLRRSTEVQEGLGRVSEAVEEAVSGQALVRAYTLRGTLGRRFADCNRDYLQSNLALARLRALVLPVMTVVGPLGTLLVFFFGGPLVVHQQLSLGELVAFNAYLVQLAWPTTLLGWVLTLQQRARASVGRLRPLLDADREPAGGEAPRPGPPAVVAAGLDLDLTGRPVLQGLDFSVPAGALVGVTGPTGAGKSSLLAVLAGLHRPAPGQLKIAGQDLADLDLRAHRRRLAVVPQEGRLFSGSLGDNLLYASPDAEAGRLEEIARLVALDGEVEDFPAGFATSVGEGGVSLSGGQRQRVALGRALARGGELWLLDDPFNHLDAATARRIWERLRPRLRGRTVFLVSSRVSLLAGADLVLVLDGGRLAESGNHRQLLAAGGLYARLRRREELRATLEEAP
jgi:ATP-binding cassette subfamily B protein